MGNGIGINCKRCGQQLSYDNWNFDKEEEICGECIEEWKKRIWDNEHKDIIQRCLKTNN